MEGYPSKIHSSKILNVLRYGVGSLITLTDNNTDASDLMLLNFDYTGVRPEISV